MENNFRFFFFQYGKEIRVFLFTTLLLGSVAFGKAKFDQWQGSRYNSWATTEATILDAKITERIPNREHSQLHLFRAQLTVEYSYQGKWLRGEVLVNTVPPSRLSMMGPGNRVTIRVYPAKDSVPAFRWTDQEITLPTS